MDREDTAKSIHPSPDQDQNQHEAPRRDQKGNYIEETPAKQESTEAFRADAKAEGEDVELGGWEVRHGLDPKEAKWFSIKITRRIAPWVFAGGEPFRKIATLELLATLLCVLAFPPPEEGARNEVLTLSAGTDNLGNTMAVSKLMTTKFPLCAAMMQLSSTLAVNKWRLKLNWIPRDQNFEADELSNGLKHRFEETNEVNVRPLLEKLVIFNKMMKYGSQLYEEIKSIKTEKKEVRGRKPRSEERDKAGAKKHRRRGHEEAPKKLKERDPW